MITPRVASGVAALMTGEHRGDVLLPVGKERERDGVENGGDHREVHPGLG